MKVQCEFVAPPRTKEFMADTQMQNIFALLVQRVVKKEMVRDNSGKPPLAPDYIRVIPFTSVDGEVKFEVESYLSLAEKGRVNVRQDVFATKWTNDTMSMVNSDTGDIIIPSLGAYEAPFTSLNVSYVLEAFMQQGAE